jgi:hypothetical protein
MSLSKPPQSASSSSKDAKPAMSKCVDCIQMMPFGETKPYSGSGLNGKRQCHKCSSIRVALTRHSKDNILKAFNKKTPEEKTEYFKLQHEKRKDLANPRSVPYDFNDLKGVQTQYDVEETIDDVVIKWLPFRNWYIEEKILNPTYDAKVAKADFESQITAHGAKAKKVSGTWCLSVFCWRSKFGTVPHWHVS